MSKYLKRCVVVAAVGIMEGECCLHLQEFFKMPDRKCFATAAAPVDGHVAGDSGLLVTNECINELFDLLSHQRLLRNVVEIKHTAIPDLPCSAAFSRLFLRYTDTFMHSPRVVSGVRINLGYI